MNRPGTEESVDEGEVELSSQHITLISDTNTKGSRPTPVYMTFSYMESAVEPLKA